MKPLRSLPNRLRDALGSMRVRVLAACFCAALIASVVSANITYNAAAAVIRRNALDQVAQLLDDADERMNQAVAEMEEVALFLAVDRDLVEALTDTARPVSYAWYMQWKAVQQALDQFMAHRPNIARIDLIGREKAFSSDSLMLFSEMKRQIRPQESLDAIDQQWRYDVDGDASMAYVRGVYQGRARVGTVLICLDEARLAEFYRPQLYPDGFLFVLSPEGDVLYGSEKGASNILETRFAGVFEAETPEEAVSIEGHTYLARRTVADRTGLTTLALISDQALMRDSIHLRRQSTVMLAVLLLLSLGGAFLVSRQISVNLHRLGKAMRRVEEGDLSVSLKLRGHDEVARLGDGFQTMMETIQSLFAKVADQERARHQAELRALQAQIGPHFMCNALSSIKYLAILQDAKNIEEMSGALAEMVRVLLGSLEEEITVREELQLLESYVLIQKYRLLDRVRVDFDVEEAALDAR
ncbi:MAG TPA: histidine kinase, partial [Clostridia bacterium]|nr:histidine kinase [Clostridia bacterium]